MKLESKVGKIEAKDEKVYTFLTNFDNFKHLIPADKVKDWQSNEDSCTFTVDPIGKTGIKILEKEPYKLIKLSGIDNKPFDFKLWVQLKKLEESTTAVKITVEVDLNPMLQAMAKKPLQNFIDTLVDQLSKIKYS
jgi:carbon monoxide dehydrogenase subunit G